LGGEMKKPILPIAFCSIFIFTFIGCEVQPKLSPMQIREITTKMFDCDYENVYRATITVLQDQGYVIKNTDMNSGLILASVDRKAKTGNQVLEALFLGFIANKGTEIEVSCIVNKLSDSATEIRPNIQEVKYGQSSIFSGTSKQDSKQIYDPEVYKSIFDQISVEIERRKAIKK
jgi:hypothetical protein